MKTKAIVATLLIAAAASADARFAWPYPPKAVSPDEIGHWVVINGNAWPDSTESKLTTFADGQTRRGEASPSGGEPEEQTLLSKWWTTPSAQAAFDRVARPARRADS
jgi:hypothetical protein